MGERGWKADWEDPSERWRDVRRWQIQRRAIEVEERLAGEPLEIAWLVDEVGLTEPQREACVLRYGYELTLGEIGERLGVTKTAVVERLAWARKKVEAYWGTWDPELVQTPGR